MDPNQVRERHIYIYIYIYPYQLLRNLAYSVLPVSLHPGILKASARSGHSLNGGSGYGDASINVDDEVVAALALGGMAVVLLR